MKLYETLSGTEVSISELEKPDYSKNYLFSLSIAKYLVNNQRDLPIIYMILNNLLFICIGLPLVWYFQSHFLGLTYVLINYTVFFGRYMCLNHEYAHIQVFKIKRLGDFISTFILGHSHGLPFGSYYIQHVIMHHKGANKWGVDLSSTEKYNRENNLNFIHYWLRRYSPLFFVMDAVLTCFRYGRFKIGILYGLYSYSWFGLIIYIVCFTKYWIAGMWTMFIPMCLTSFFGGVGGWMQHFFLHPTKPQKWYSYDLINSFANTHGFNQGFHNVHHTLGNLHWTELPSGFISLLEDYNRDNVMIIQKLDNVQVFFLIMSKQYEVLARYLVCTRPGGHSLKYCVDFIRSHLRIVDYCLKKSE
jgi:hypothetical protein